MSRIEGFIHRIEKEGAVISMIDHAEACVSAKILPGHVQEGDFLVEDEATSELHVDPWITEQHHREIRRMAEEFFD
jgi:hypothetical protein